jgi:hypothetical protein
MHSLFHAFLEFAEYEKVTGGKWGTGGCRCGRRAHRAPRTLEFALSKVYTQAPLSFQACYFSFRPAPIGTPTPSSANGNPNGQSTLSPTLGPDFLDLSPYSAESPYQAAPQPQEPSFVSQPLSTAPSPPINLSASTRLKVSAPVLIFYSIQTRAERKAMWKKIRSIN